MERKLISGNSLFDKIAFSFLLAILLMLPAVEFLKYGWSNSDFIFMIIVVPISGVLWLIFDRVHPVYFDENFLYWIKRGKEQKVSLSKIEKLSISNTQTGEIGELKYFDESSNAKSISFITTDDMLVELKQFVQAKNPGFKIILEGLFKNREL